MHQREEVIINGKLFELYLLSDEIQKKVKQIARNIEKDFKDRNPLFIGVLNGAFIFASDIVRNLGIDCEVSFVRIASYRGFESTGDINELIGLNENIENRHIIVVEDIVDTGLTIDHLVNNLQENGAKSVSVASMILKTQALKIPVKIDYLGFEADNAFLIGYGMDYDHKGRNLNHIYKLKPK